MKRKKIKINPQMRLKAVATGRAVTTEQIAKSGGVRGALTTYYFSNGEVEQHYNFQKEGIKKAKKLTKLMGAK